MATPVKKWAPGHGECRGLLEGLINVDFERDRKDHWGRKGSSKVLMSWPVSAFHSFAGWSIPLPPVSTRAPSGENATEKTPLSVVKVLTSFPVPASQSFAVLSLLPVST